VVAAAVTTGIVVTGLMAGAVAVPIAYRAAAADALRRPVLPAAAATLPRPENWPRAGVGASAHRLLPPVTPPHGKGGYRFENVQADGHTPVGWDPCRPIRYVVRGRAPAGTERVIGQAVAQVAAATGLRFDYAGTTTEKPVDNRDPYQPGRYGDRWAPLLIAWSNQKETPELKGDTMGLGGAWRVPEPTADGWGKEVYVTGTVWLDKPQVAQMLAAGGRRSDPVGIARALVMHELGHALGLAHVRDRRQLMYPETHEDVTTLAAGDRRGLAALGRVECAPAT
jgi:hypothetical protein